MKDFHRNFICRSTETGKKGHRNKHHSNKNEVCKCHVPFLKLHYYDCPVARKPCPVHGSPFRQCVEDEKEEKKENMIISFHPSSKTDRLFRPVKNLLAHCNPETKIHLEYYSPDNSTSKDDMKHRQTETNPEQVKKNIGNNVFVEKSKSLITDKTNKMKRLKQCFHSPCNSVVARTKSQFTLTDKINENFTSKEPPENKYFSGKFKWTSSNKLDSSDWEKSSNDKVEPDFVTVTKQSDNKVVDHKIFEIKHKKGLGDIRYTKIPKQSPFVYSSFGAEELKNVTSDVDVQEDPSSNQKKLEKYPKNKEIVDKSVDKEDLSTSEKAQSSSSGSVYFTSHIFRLGIEESGSDESKSVDDIPKQPRTVNEKVRAKGAEVDTVNASVQTETPENEKSAYEGSSTSENITISKSSEPDEKITPLRQERGVGSAEISFSNKYSYSSEQSQSRASKVSRRRTNEYPYMNVSQNTSKSENKSSQVSPTNSRLTNEYGLFEDELYNKERKSKSSDPSTVLEETRKRFSDKQYSSSLVQTEPVQRKEVLLIYDGTVKVADKMIQTNPITMRNVQVETMAAKKNKSQMTYSTNEKFVQTSFTLSDSQSQSNEGESADLDSNGNYKVTSYIGPAYSQSAQQSQWKKSHSDGDLFSGQPESESNVNVFPLHHICFCENSETSISEMDLNGCEKTDQPREGSLQPIPQNQNNLRRSSSRKDESCPGEQTALSDLSELARILRQFFSKASRETFIVCEGKKMKSRDSKTSQGIKADSCKSVNVPKTEVVDAEVQTTFKVIVDLSEEEKSNADSSKAKKNWNFPPQDNEETTFVCKVCRRKMSPVVAQADKAIDSVEKSSFSKKEVMFANVGTSTEGLGTSVLIAKRSIDISVSDYSRMSGFENKQQMTLPDEIFTNHPNNAPVTRKPLNQSKSFSVCEPNRQTPKDWSISITTTKCPAFSEPPTSKADSKGSSDKPFIQKEPTPTNQLVEKKSAKTVKTSGSWKSTDCYLLNETYEKFTISNTPDPCKPKSALPAPGKSSSPAPAAASKKTINFRNNETARPKMNTQAIFMQGTSKRFLQPQTGSCEPALSFNRNTLCICSQPGTSNSKPVKPSIKTEPAAPGKSLKYSDKKPPRPTKKTGAPGSRPPSNTSPGTAPKKPAQKKTIVYPAIIRPMWYTDITKTLQIIKNIQGLLDSDSSILKQKRSCEGDDDSPGGKKIKGRDEGSGESLDFEESVFAANGETIIDMRNKTGFVWIPSSALEVPKRETNPLCFFKDSQSETKLPKNYSQNTTLFRGFTKRTPSNVLSVKSCRLKPVQVHEKHPFRKLFEFRLCKSLNFLKSEQKSAFFNDNPSDSAFGYESPKGEDENPLSDEEHSNVGNWAFSPSAEDEYLGGYSNTADASDFIDLSENSDLVGENSEARNDRIESNDAHEAESFSGCYPASKSFDTFWFGSGTRKK